MQTIHNLQRFADIVPSIRGLDRHYDAFFPVDNADCSFLTDFDSIAEGLEAAKNDSDNYLAMVGSNSPLSRLAALKDILKSEDYVAAVSNLLFADQEVAPYAGMKKMILCLSMEETDEATALLLDTYCTVIMNYLRLSTAKEKVGKDNPFISASTEQILPIDLLIAQSIKSSKSGSPQEVDTNLDEFLEYYPLICTSSWEDQLFILQKVFAYLKMYSQERKVLEFLVKNNIPRTEQIDRRLNFLKNLNQNDISNAANSIEEFSIQTSDNEIAYDYRFISWTVSEINSYMNLLTSEDKTLDLPMVVAEWNKKIPQKNIRWRTLQIREHRLELALLQLLSTHSGAAKGNHIKLTQLCGGHVRTGNDGGGGACALSDAVCHGLRVAGRAPEYDCYFAHNGQPLFFDVFS